MATQTKTPEVAPDAPFRIESTKKVPPPEGMSGEWYRYVISRGSGANAVVGHRQGTLKSVTAALEEVVEQMNLRRSGKTGRVHLTPSRKKSA
ncbi:MAG: hypothetical protein P8080_11805 [Gammaproteobacteria bacterium]